MPNTDPDPVAVHVVAAVIFNAARDQVLIAHRPEHLHQGGLWEFPGGKVEMGESPRAALARELWEELALRVVRCAELMQVVHAYPDKTVQIDVWTVDEIVGTPVGNEGQAVAWVPLTRLSEYPFPAANQDILARLLT